MSCMAIIGLGYMLMLMLSDFWYKLCLNPYKGWDWTIKLYLIMIINLVSEIFISHAPKLERKDRMGSNTQWSLSTHNCGSSSVWPIPTLTILSNETQRHFFLKSKTHFSVSFRKSLIRFLYTYHFHFLMFPKTCVIKNNTLTCCPAFSLCPFF